MASTLSRSTAAINAEASNVTALLNSGTLNIYSGTQPVNANTALSGNTLLAAFTFASSAFGSPTAGLATAAAISSVTAAATGTATFFRCVKSDGTTVVMDGSVGTSGTDCIINSTSIASGATVSVISFTYQATA